MTCNRCGQTHDPTKCTGHVDTDAGGNQVPLRPCRAWPVKGATVCVKHGAGAPQVAAAANRRLAGIKLRAEAARDISRLGVTIDLDDGEAVRAMRDEAAGNVVAYRNLIQRLHLGESSGFNDDEHRGESGIYTAMYHQTGVPTGEAKPHILIVMYDAERDRLAKLDEVCVKLGLEGRRVALEEDRSAMFVRALERVLSRYGIDPTVIDVRSSLADELEAVNV
jgi:hypothetical protein